MRHLLPLLALHCHPLRFLTDFYSIFCVLAGLGPADVQGQEILIDEIRVLAEAFPIEAVRRRQEGVGEILTGFFEALLMVVYAFQFIDLIAELPAFLL